MLSIKLKGYAVCVSYFLPCTLLFFFLSPISETDVRKQTLKEREEMTFSFTRREEESFDYRPFAISDFSSPVACLPSSLRFCVITGVSSH